MSGYEITMIILGILTLVLAIIGIIVKLILYIIDMIRDEIETKK